MCYLKDDTNIAEDCAMRQQHRGRCCTTVAVRNSCVSHVVAEGAAVDPAAVLGDHELARRFIQLAQQRLAAIQALMWDDDAGAAGMHACDIALMKQ